MNKSNPHALNRESIKLIAIVMMTLNHYARLFLCPETVIYELFLGLGYATAPIMCYFLVEGFHYTRSRKAYAMRLFIFGLISEIPFCLVYTGGKSLICPKFNMIWTLLLCLILLIVQVEIEDRAMRIGLTIGLIYASCYFDWAIFAPIYTFLFYRAGENKKTVRSAFFLTIALVFINELLNYAGSQPLADTILFSLLHITGPVIAAGLILLFYNGKKSLRAPGLSKWFFYIYYPAHLLVLGLCKRYGLL